MKKVIVTGATGFIGSHLVEYLLEEKNHIILIVRNKSKLMKEFLNNNYIEIIEDDIDNLTEESFNLSDEYSVFYHVAWAGVNSLDKNNVSMQIDNIRVSIKAMELCNKIKCQLFVATGTVAEYVFSNNIMDVNSRQTPNDYYGAAKVSAHYFLDVSSRKLNQDYIWCMLPSTFGERRLDNNIISYTITSLLKGDRPRYGHLMQLWDFMYVKDVVRALCAVGEKGISGTIYGIGSGKYRTLKDYITSIKEIMNSDIELGIGEIEDMSNQTISSCVNIYNLVRDTGFEPSISFEDGIKRTIEYYKINLY